MTDAGSLPSGGPTREEIAKVEIGHTDVSPSVARGLTAFFLAALVAVPLIEIVVPRLMPAGERPTVWTTLGRIPGDVSTAVADAERAGASSWSRIVTANRTTMSGLVAFEDALESESVLGHALRPSAQRLLSGWLGAGNEQVYVGRRDEDGARWLFYRPDLEYLTNQGFLEDHVLRRRVAAASELTTLPQPDPRPAILAFHRELEALGAVLVIVPTPVKPGIHPEQLVPSIDAGAEAIQNSSYGELVQWLDGQGILTFEPGAGLLAARRSGPQYLATDTHWRPEAMELAASELAAFISANVALPAQDPPGYTIEQQEIVNAGDTAVMLDLSETQELYPPETVLIRRVVGPDGTVWRSSRDAGVLVLGDSFSNIYSLASMGWGDSAGFVEHLSFALRRPVDRIVQNADGAYATREMLQREGAARLAGKRVVVWQFAARELAFGDWKVFE
ncbi:MAG: hypothetical protein AB7F99_00260 [Vicinamibacterales bacterium]